MDLDMQDVEEEPALSRNHRIVQWQSSATSLMAEQAMLDHFSIYEGQRHAVFMPSVHLLQDSSLGPSRGTTTEPRAPIQQHSPTPLSPLPQATGHYPSSPSNTGCVPHFQTELSPFPLVMPPPGLALHGVAFDSIPTFGALRQAPKADIAYEPYLTPLPSSPFSRSPSEEPNIRGLSCMDCLPPEMTFSPSFPSTSSYGEHQSPVSLLEQNCWDLSIEDHGLPQDSTSRETTPNVSDWSTTASPNLSVSDMALRWEGSSISSPYSEAGSSTPSTALDYSGNNGLMVPGRQSHRGHARSESSTPLPYFNMAEEAEPQFLAVSSFNSRRYSEPAPLQQNLHERNASASGAAQMPFKSNIPRKSLKAPAASVQTSHPFRSRGVVRQIPPGAQRGRRHGPLKANDKVQVRRMRRDKLCCVRCRQRKVKCTPMSQGCLQCILKKPNEQNLACATAYFYKLIEKGSLNYIAQRSINHPRKDLRHRQRLAVPEVIEPSVFLESIRSLSCSNHLRVSQGAHKLYDIDLAASFDYLSPLFQSLSPPYSFRKLIDDMLEMDVGWPNCIVGEEARLRDNPVAALNSWNNMPSRVTYSLVSKASGSPRSLDPDNPLDRSHIYNAAHLSRILSRKLELSAYFQLEQNLLRTPSDAMLGQLSSQLLSLRWRISWWTVLGSGIPGSRPDESEQEDICKTTERVTEVCKSLYVSYCYIRAHSKGMSRPPELKRRYADTAKEVTETLPNDDTEGGFWKWMADGQMKIREAGVAEQLVRVGLA